MLCLHFSLFILINKYHYFYEEYACSMCETKYSNKISQVYLCGEQLKPNADEGDILLILIFGIPCLLIVLVFLHPSLDINISFLHFS